MALSKNSARKDIKQNLKKSLLEKLARQLTRDKPIAPTGASQSVQIDVENAHVLELEPDERGTVWFRMRMTFFDSVDSPVSDNEAGICLCSGTWDMVKNRIDYDVNVEKLQK